MTPDLSRSSRPACAASSFSRHHHTLKWFALLFFCTVMLLAASGQRAHAQHGLPDFTELAAEQGPAVVNISTTQTIQNALQGFPGLPFDSEDPAFEFFRRFMPQIPGHGGAPREFQNKSLGSGFIISNDGYILTNAHVVSEADEVTVRLTDKREFKARIIGADKRTDVALIKIDAQGLPAVRLGSPQKLKVGEWVIAIGSPFGFDSSVTAGIVSAKGRSLPQENYVPFIQTDVAINPGNSGGPLFNMNGEVVGINSQIYSRSGGYMGVSFAIPIDVAMDIQRQLRNTGKVQRGRLGVVIQEVSQELAESLGLPQTQGAVVNAVDKDGPAAQVLKAGDVILKFNGKAVTQSADLPRLVASQTPGNKATLEIWRRGKTQTVSVVIGTIEDDDGVPNKRSKGKKSQPSSNRLGLVLAPLTSAQKQKLQLDHGLRIQHSLAQAQRRDLQEGDIILAIIYKGQTHDAVSVEKFSALLDDLPKNAMFTLLLRRGDVQTFITLRGLD